MENDPITFSDFEKIKIQVGTILEASIHEKARKPAFKMKIDLGEGVIRQSSAQITDLYSVSDLIGKQVVCITNLEPRKIAGWTSEILVTGFGDSNGHVILAVPDSQVSNGSKLY